jgi:hypothetical protein
MLVNIFGYWIGNLFVNDLYQASLFNGDELKGNEYRFVARTTLNLMGVLKISSAMVAG